MAKAELPSPELLRKLLNYDADTGVLTWNPRDLSAFPCARSGKIWNTRYAGRRAGHSNDEGYLAVTVLGQRILGHRIAWAMHYGEWPSADIDHINGLRGDNRIANLRIVTVAVNARNQAIPKNNKSGVVGVCYCKQSGKWRAYIRTWDRNRELGRFDTLAQAAAARAAADVINDYHPNHGRRA